MNESLTRVLHKMRASTTIRTVSGRAKRGKLLESLYSIRYQLLLLAFAAIPFHSFFSGGLVLWDDLALPPFAVNQLSKSLLVWHSGSDDIAALNLIPLNALMTLVESIPLPLSFLQQAYFLVGYWLMGLSMFFLARTLFPDKSSLCYFLAAMLYMFNPILATYNLVGGVRSWMLAYALNPLVLAFFARSLSSSHSKNWEVVGFLLAAVSFTTNTWGTFITLVFLTGYAVISSVVDWSFERFLRNVAILLRVILVFALLGAFWIIPGALYLPVIYSLNSRFTGAQVVNAIALIKSNGPNIVNVIRLYSSPYDYGFQFFYNTIVSGAIGLIISFMALVGILIGRPKKSTLIASGLFVLFVCLASVASNGLLPYYVALLDHIPFGRAFLPVDVNWYLFYGVPLCLALLLGAGVVAVITKYPRVKVIVVPVIVVLLLINSWPILTGYNTPYKADGLEISFNQPTQIPTYYSQFQTYMSQQGNNFNMFLLPSPTVLFYSQYSWLPKQTGWTNVNPNQGIQDLVPTLLLQNTGVDTYYVQPYSPSPQPLLQTIEHAIYQNLTQHAGRLLQLVGAKFLVFRTDLANPIQWTNTTAAAVNISTAKQILDHQRDLSLVAQFGSILVYRNTEYTSDVYVAQRVIAIDENTSVLIPLSNQVAFDGTAFAFRSDYSSAEWQHILANAAVLVMPSDGSNISEEFPGFQGLVVPSSELSSFNLPPLPAAQPIQLFYQNPIDLRISVGNFTAGGSPSGLVLNQAEDPGWVVTCRGLSATRFNINGFSSMYYVPCLTGGQISLEYAPYHTFVLSSYLSVASALAITALVLFYRFHNREKQTRANHSLVN